MEISLENLYVDIGAERVKLEHGTDYLTVPDPDLEIRGGPVIQTLT